MREKYKGQSLLEVVVAVAIAAILAVSVISTNLLTQRTGKSAENNTRATKLVQDGIEKMRIYRDRQGFDSFHLSGGCFTLNTTSPNPALWVLDPDPPCIGEEIDFGDITFSRSYDIDPNVDDRRLIKVTINWHEASGLKNVENSTFLSKWED